MQVKMNAAHQEEVITKGVTLLLDDLIERINKQLKPPMHLTVSTPTFNTEHIRKYIEAAEKATRITACLTVKCNATLVEKHSSTQTFPLIWEYNIRQWKSAAPICNSTEHMKLGLGDPQFTQYLIIETELPNTNEESIISVVRQIAAQQDS